MTADYLTVAIFPVPGPTGDFKNDGFFFALSRFVLKAQGVAQVIAAIPNCKYTVAEMIVDMLCDPGPDFVVISL